MKNIKLPYLSDSVKSTFVISIVLNLVILSITVSGEEVTRFENNKLYGIYEPTYDSTYLPLLLQGVKLPTHYIVMFADTVDDSNFKIVDSIMSRILLFKHYDNRAMSFFECKDTCCYLQYIDFTEPLKRDTILTQCFDEYKKILKKHLPDDMLMFTPYAGISELEYRERMFRYRYHEFVLKDSILVVAHDSYKYLEDSTVLIININSKDTLDILYGYNSFKISRDCKEIFLTKRNEDRDDDSNTGYIYDLSDRSMRKAFPDNLKKNISNFYIENNNSEIYYIASDDMEPPNLWVLHEGAEKKLTDFPIAHIPCDFELIDDSIAIEILHLDSLYVDVIKILNPE